MIFTILTLTVLVFSYMFILQPAYDPPESEVNEGGYIGVDTENSYLQKQKDGSYCLIMVDEAGNEHFLLSMIVQLNICLHRVFPSRNKSTGGS